MKFKSFIIAILIVFNMAKVANAGAPEFIEAAQIGSTYLCDRDISAAFVDHDVVQNRQGFGWGVFTLKIIDRNKILFKGLNEYETKITFVKTQVENNYVDDERHQMRYLVVFGRERNQDGIPQYLSVNISTLSFEYTGISLHKCNLVD